MKESMDQLNVCMVSSNLTNKSYKDVFKSIVEETMKVIQTDRTFYQSMLSQNGQMNFANELKDTLKRFMVSGLALRYQPYMDVPIEYMCSGLSGVICLWINNADTLSLDDIILQVSELNYRILHDML